METSDFIIGDVTYTFKKADFFKAMATSKKLGGLLNGCLNGKSFDIGRLFENISKDPCMPEIEKFILNYTTALDEEGNRAVFQNPAEISKFFYSRRNHYYAVLFEGIKFHFLDFLPVGLLSKINIEDLEAEPKG